MTVFGQIVFFFIIAWFGPVMIIKAHYKQDIAASVFFWFAIAVTGFVSLTFL